MRTTKENIKGVYPLSPMQEGMLHHALADQGRPSYMQQVCWTVRGTLDCGLLEKSWNILLARHDGLRTVFAHEGTDRPLQVVVKDARLRVDFQDLRALAEERREPVRREIMELQRTTPFNLSRDLLMRLLVIRRADDLYDVVWTHHHLLLDGWSVGILLGEFLHIYSRLKEDLRPELARPVPVKGYIAWLERRSREIPRAFWNERLRGYSRIADIAPSGLDLSSFKGEQGSVSTLLTPDLYGALQARAAECGVTVAVVLQSIWAVVLSRYNDRDDVVFGLVVSGRPAEVEGIESMVGNLINTVAVRVRLDRGMSWRSLAEKIQEESLLAAPHHHYPLAAVQRESALPAGLFSTIMAVESYPVDAGVEAAARSGAPGFVLESTAVHERTNYPLDLQFLPTPQGLRCSFFYGRDQYEDARIEALMRHFTRCAAACAASFAAVVDSVGMLDRSDLDRLLFEFNAPEADLADLADRTVVELFEDQAARTPEAVALVCGEARLSYAELNRRANRLAHVLIDEYQVAPGDVMGILLPRSAEYIVAILGILKAGATYLPLDPEIPEPRLADMVRECRARYVILETEIVEELPFKNRLSEPFVETIPRFTPPRPPITDLDTLPIINRSLIDYEAYNQFLGQSTARFSAAIQATRGCPYKCAYCHKIWPKTHIRRSPEHLFAEIEKLHDCGFKRFVFIDDIFNLDRAASRSFFEKVIGHNLQCQFFFSNGLRGDILSHDEIDLMVEAGTIQMAFALETASPRLQKLIGKHLHIDRLQDNLAYIAAKYPQVILELFTMHGFPTETPEEAQTTLEFIKGIRWLHFPYIFILRIFPDTEMAGIASSHGISEQAIRESMELGYNELPTTLPFAREVSTRYQMAFLNEYFLDRDRLRQVLPWQMRVMDERSLVLKYDSYLPAEIKTLDDILEVAGMSRADLGDAACIQEEEIRPPDLNRRIARVFAPTGPAEPVKDAGRLRILLLDLSQYFAEEKTLLYDVVEPPLGLASLLTVLNRRFGGKVVGRIVKARIDFADFDGLRRLVAEFRPDCIGVRTLTFYRNFFHKGVELLRQWGFNGPIIAGGPYATSSTALLLSDVNVDAAVIGEGEVTFCEVVEKMLAGGSDCAGADLFKNIAGLAFIPAEQRKKIRDSSCRFLTVERLSAAMAGTMDIAAANPPRKAGPADGIYIIHTSGSTGKPKGVMVEHHSMSNLVGWLKRTVYGRYPAPLREATVAPLIFDVSAQQIFGAFSSGYTLYLVPGDIAAAPSLLLAYLKEQRVQMVNVTPSRLAMMLDAIDQGGEPMTVDQLLVGAEKFPRSMVERFYAHPGHGNIVIRNMYGPTECCVDAASWLFGIDSFRQWLHPPLGKAIDNAYFRILDRAMRPVPIGVFGELYIGGEGVAREYVNRPNETGRSFVADPFADAGRLYRTGDRVRWTADGMIEFGGRIDNQLKVRGFRIEPEEIEQWLGRHPAVAGAAVTVLGSEGEADTLAAFIVTRSEVTVEALQDYLRSSLPAYMIPAVFATVEELPLGTSGKLDRLQLRAMSGSNQLHRAAPVETPRSEEERVLEQAWRIVLGEQALSIHDNYFALGGDSIKAIQVVSRLARVGWSVTIRDLFRYPTIAQLAPHIVPVKASEKIAAATDQAPLIPIQTAFMENHKVEPNRFNHAMALAGKERIDLAALQAAWDCVLATHDSLNSCFRRKSETWRQEACRNRGRRIELYENPSGIEEVAERLHGSLNIETGELAAAACIRTSDGDRILLVIHHLAVDGISWRIILGDLIECYGKARAGITPALVPPPVSFIQWSNTLASHAGDSRFVSQLPYWQAVAQSDDPLAAALAGKGKEKDCYGESAVVRFDLDRQDTERLRLVATQRYSTTVEDLLLCALGRALLAEHGIGGTLITLESHGREETFGLDLGRTCGWLTVTYPFALAIPAERDLAYQIKAVKESLRAVPDRGVGYGILRYMAPKELTRSYDLSCSPAIGFNYLGRLEAGQGDLFKVELGAYQASAVNPLAERPHLLDISGIVAGDMLSVSLTYSRRACEAEAAQSLAEALRVELLAIIEHCCDGRLTEPTPSDLTYSDLTLDELEGIL